VARGIEVTALSRGGSALPDGSPTLAVDLSTEDPDASLLEGVDVVFHLAGIAHRRADQAAYRALNEQATLRLARLAAGAGVGCFVFLSSVKAMGPPGGGAPRSEAECHAPGDAYGLSKWRAECALREEFADSPMSLVILRPALIYGAGARGNLALLSRAVRAGLPRPPEEGKRSMLGLSDLVELLCDIAADPPSGVHTWIACDDQPYSTRYLYDLLREASGRGHGRAWLPRWAWRLGTALLDLRGATGDEPSFQKLFGTEVYSNRALREATGWRPRGNLAQAAASMVHGGGPGP
jgi:nucleoside-diphosphate-sugar epimerase